MSLTILKQEYAKPFKWLKKHPPETTNDMISIIELLSLMIRTVSTLKECFKLTQNATN